LIVDAWKVNSRIDFIELWNNNIGVEGFRLVAEVFQPVDLDLFDKYLDVNSCKELAQIIKLSSSLQTLDVSFNQIRDEGAHAIAEAIPFSNTLRFINLHCNDIEDEGAAALIESLKRNSSVVEMNLEDNEVISEDVLDDIKNVLSKNRKQFIQEIVKDISQNRKEEIVLNNLPIFEVDGLRNISKVLCVNYYLKKLELSRCKICCEGARLLSKSLHFNSTLQFLDLSFNEIGSSGVIEIADGLKFNSSLKVLYIVCANVGLDGVLALKEALLKNNTLEELSLNACGLGNKGCSEIMSALEVNRSISTIHIKDNYIGDGGAKSIEEVLKKNNYIQRFDLSMNNIPITGLNSIAKGLALNFSVIKLFYLNDQTSPEIVRILERNNKIFKNYCKMLTFELFKQISTKKSTFIDIHLAGLVLKIAGIVEK
jgi:Ran GTPase-activating protein (RanGAP) involved in mRNA processing and transport